MTLDEKTMDLSNQLLHRIRILKTGLYAVDRYLDMNDPANRARFEELATPGTELKLVRNHTDETNPYRIDVYSPDDQYLGRVTVDKSQTAARLMDAGAEVIAVVNESKPIHDSDFNYGSKDTPANVGWSETSRETTGHRICNLPFGIYLVDR